MLKDMIVMVSSLQLIVLGRSHSPLGFLSVSLLGSKSSVSPLLQPWPLLIKYGITLFMKTT